jgi:hypothetical protein
VCSSDLLGSLEAWKLGSLEAWKLYVFRNCARQAHFQLVVRFSGSSGGGFPKWFGVVKGR